MQKHHNFNPNYIHHQNERFSDTLKEIVFGLEDGMVSTLGAITGIAIGSGNEKTIILAGVVIIAVESISMGVGSYLANKSEKEMDKRRVSEEKEEIHKFPREEKEELYQMYLKHGWNEKISKEMSEFASLNKDLMLKEMKIHELKVLNEEEINPLKKGFFMFFSYVLGGFVPLFSYFILPREKAIILSTILTLIGLFFLGVFTTNFTKENKVKSGLRILLLGGVAMTIGIIVGTFLKM